MEIIKHLIGAAQGKHPIGTARSGHWPKVREEHLQMQPFCAVCGGKVKLTVHHIRPFHLHPDLELSHENLVTLCEAPGHNCHLIWGHLLNYRSFNVDVITDSAQWNEKIKTRPLSDSK